MGIAKNNSEDGVNKIRGYNGCLLISDTIAHTGKFFAFVPQETTIIASVSETQNENSAAVPVVKSDLTGETVYAGAFITSGKGDGNEYYFSSIQLTSGSGFAYYL